MHLIFARIGRHPTLAFAFKELSRILTRMNPALIIDGRIYGAADALPENVLVLRVDDSLAPGGNDSIRIDVKGGAGVIAGNSPRAVLIAAYRFLTELGCRFLFPGKAGEMIPVKPLSPQEISVCVCETASCRHRGVCIEGAVSYEHVADMIDYLPKVGMNGYFMQFHTPSTFFMRFYNTNPNPNLHPTPVTDADVSHMWESLEEEIVLRGLDYHATGHGWTCMPFGINATGWNHQTDEEMPPEALAYMAELNGHRGLYRGVALNTNLCYSNPVVRDKMNNAIVDYCRAHPDVNFLHYWLADGTNNHCECAQCRQSTPADWYVKLLNELDEKLTAADISTKIVCLIYVDLLWAPEKEKINNPDRFVLMFAPITRTYSSAFADADLSQPVTLAPYKRNENVMPRSIAENLARLSRWQKEQLRGDSFDFDYHLMWDHHLDPGYYECARILHRDMTNLHRIGLNGMVSCQLQRAFFPTGLPFYAMARGLWDQESAFEDVCGDYFTAAFGADAAAVEQYLSTLSQLFDPVYLRGEKPRDGEYYVNNMRRVHETVDRFEQDFLAKNPSRSPSWGMLCAHAVFTRAYADMLSVFLGPDSTPEKRERAQEAMADVLNAIEPSVLNVFDPVIFRSIFNRILNRAPLY